jgi:hypothetical protein
MGDLRDEGSGFLVDEFVGGGSFQKDSLLPNPWTPPMRRIWAAIRAAADDKVTTLPC